jgi:hypothetical protein
MSDLELGQQHNATLPAFTHYVVRGVDILGADETLCVEFRQGRR